MSAQMCLEFVNLGGQLFHEGHGRRIDDGMDRIRANRRSGSIRSHISQLSQKNRRT